MDPGGDMVATERAGLALWLLLQEPMSTAEAAERCGLSYEGARQLLTKLSRVVPIYREGGKWCISQFKRL